MGNPIPTQIRSVDPYSSYNSDVVNKLTRIISDGNNTLLMPSPISVEKTSDTVITVVSGKALMDDVLIEIQNINIDLTDSAFYVDSSGGVWNEMGYYYVVLHYEYQKISPPPEASILIILPSQRATIYDSSKHLFLSVLNVSAPGGIEQIDEVLNYDPDNPSIGRRTVGGGVAGTSVNYSEVGSGVYNATTDDDTIAVNTSSGDTIVILPLTTTTDRMVRIVKLTSDSNTVTVQRQGSDTIEGAASILLSEQYDVVSLAPYSSNTVWIEV